jgi:NAD(P)-dependent dehydrogenase (short-subunit alcohol dehydrogenase family)
MPGMAAVGNGDIVVTASVAGLHPIAQDPIYGLTKHAVIGLVRSLAAGIEQNPEAPDVCISAICPGFADTKIVDAESRSVLDALGIELLQPSQVAGVAMRALDERVQGAQWVVWPGQEPGVYEWRSAIG